MKPIAVFRGTSADEGSFRRLKPPGNKRRRFRAVLFSITNQGEKFTVEIKTDAACTFHEFAEGVVKQEIKDLFNDVRDNHGGTKKFGFDVYIWN